MVDNKEILKHKVESELKRKIQNAQTIVGELENEVMLVEKNSAEVKEEVTKEMESIQKKIILRKDELVQQIDGFCKIKVESLQDEIKAAYVALGSLQSVLSNLDYFDHSQLLRLHIPDAKSSKTSSKESLQFDVGLAVLERDINKWGSVYLEYGAPELKLQSSSEDDFEMIIVADSDIPQTFDERKGKAALTPKKLNSIQPELTNDLAKWLKPKISTKKENLNPVISNETAPVHIHNPLKNQFVDFPCLRTDPKSWVPVKKIQTTSETNYSKALKDIFPPDYSLPAPFWLKQKC